MNLNELKQILQEHLSDDLVLIVGSGLSAACGLPTMSDLADHLIANPHDGMTDNQLALWTTLCQMLENGIDLESALTKVKLDEILELHIINQTANIIEEHEKIVITDVISNGNLLPLSSLIENLIVTSKSLPIITTNYDRLIELAAESVGIYLDTSFIGQVVGRFDPSASRESLGFAITTRTKRGVKRTYRPHVKLFKPHGSLDWHTQGDEPIRCTLNPDLPRLMITPGSSKYVRGYEQPFDQHRAEANKAVDRAARFLVVGYGFNDQQLETHLRPRLRNGIPCVVLTRSLSQSGAELMTESPNLLTLTDASGPGGPATRISSATNEEVIPNIGIWDLANFVEEVL